MFMFIYYTILELYSSTQIMIGISMNYTYIIYVWHVYNCKARDMDPGSCLHEIITLIENNYW
jgi:hypothetical protein